MSTAFRITNDDLFAVKPSQVEAWRPRALEHENWPPDYRAVYQWRLRQLKLFESPAMLASAKAYYATRPAEFIMHWMDTYNPRKIGAKWIPFVFFTKQCEVIDFFDECARDGESGLVEKCRDAGVTWLACGYSVHSWLFRKDDAIGWGSRKEMLVDKLGDPDSIFEKMRLIVRRLPKCFLPQGLNAKRHLTHMKMTNPENGSIIAGEAGDNIGRGGRKRMVFKDESAHYERAELIEAALGDNTNTQIDISSVNGPNNIFHRRRENGVEWAPGGEYEPGLVRVLVIDWRDHPEKTQSWYDLRKSKAEREGMLHVLAQEVDRNYYSAVSNVVIPIEYIQAAIDAHKKLPGNWTGPQMGALDVAGEDTAGSDANAFVRREGLIARFAQEWRERDPGVSTRNVIAASRHFKGIVIQYDAIGIGMTVKAEYNRLVTDGSIKPRELQLVPWDAGAGVVNPYFNVIPDDDESPLNRDFYENFKAQAWWSVRTRFFKTWNAVTNGALYPVDELISIDSKMPLINQLMKELNQVRQAQSSSLKLLIEKTPKGDRSPNIADAFVMCYFPVEQNSGVAIQGTYGNG